MTLFNSNEPAGHIALPMSTNHSYDRAAIPTLVAAFARLPLEFPVVPGRALAVPVAAPIELLLSPFASATFEVAERPATSRATFDGRTFAPDVRGAYLLRVGLAADADDTQRPLWWLAVPVAALDAADFPPLVGYSAPAFALERLRAIQTKVAQRSYAELAADFAARPRPGTLPW